VNEFLIEVYVSRADAAAAARGTRRTRLAAEQLSREGTPVRVVRSIFVPEDETCFLLCAAASPDAVLEAARRAALPCERVSAVAAPTDDEQER
jgi:hypothetical protein